MRQGLTTAALMALLALGGCQFYNQSPLPEGPDFASVSNTVPPNHLLTLEEIAIHAVQNNPDLVASRAKADIAKAQAFAAGLLPDPELAASADHPTNLASVISNGLGPIVNGYAFGLSEDLQQLLTYPSRRAAADAASDQAKLSLLWDEWQTIEKSDTLAAKKYYDDAKAARLGQSADLLKTQADHSDVALNAGNTTIDLAGGDLAAALDTASQHSQAERDALAADTDLKQLLNFAPDSSVQLADPGDPMTIRKEDVDAALANIDKVRPDLLALQAGYKAQEEAVRQSILEQFPSITLGANRAADTSNVHTTGLSLNINLPLFNGARGNIRIQHATRAELRAEYQARLDQTNADAWQLWREIQLLQSEEVVLEEKLPEFRRMAEVGQQAHANGDLPPATYVVLQTSLQAREGELFDLKAALWSDTIALHTLLGMPFVQPPPEPSSDEP